MGEGATMNRWSFTTQGDSQEHDRNGGGRLLLTLRLRTRVMGDLAPVIEWLCDDGCCLPGQTGWNQVPAIDVIRHQYTKNAHTIPISEPPCCDPAVSFFTAC